MSKILLLVAVFFLLVSAGLGFVNKGKIAAKQADLNQIHLVATSAQADATAAKAKQKKSEKDAAEAISKSNELQGQLSAATTQVSTLSGQIDEAKKNIDDKESQIAQLKDTIAKVTTTPGGGAPTATSPDAKVADLEMQLSEMKTVKESLESRVKLGETQVTALENKIRVRESGESMRGLQGKVLAVNHDWNFVVLSLGGRNGVNNNANMVVQRGGSLVGKLRITSVEPSQSIADIVPNSVPAGIMVQPGDIVVYGGTL